MMMNVPISLLLPNFLTIQIKTVSTLASGKKKKKETNYILNKLYLPKVIKYFI